MNYRKGKMKVTLAEEDGRVLTQERGFTIREENKVLAFDCTEHPEYGNTLLFGDQVFFLKFWTEEQLLNALELVSSVVNDELLHRESISNVSAK